MPVAAPTPYPSSPNPTTPVIISLSLYLAALLIAAYILRYFHLRSNPPPYECHISQPLTLMNLPTHPRPILSQSGFPSSQPLEFTPYTPLLLPSLPSSSPLKDFLDIRPTSPANSSSSSYISSPLLRSSTSMPAQMTYLTTLASHFALPSPSSWDQSSNYSTPIPSTATWRSSLVKSSTQRSDRSISPFPELSNNTTTDKWESTPPSCHSPGPLNLLMSRVTYSHPSN